MILFALRSKSSSKIKPGDKLCTVSVTDSYPSQFCHLCWCFYQRSLHNDGGLQRGLPASGPNHSNPAHTAHLFMWATYIQFSSPTHIVTVLCPFSTETPGCLTGRLEFRIPVTTIPKWCHLLLPIPLQASPARDGPACSFFHFYFIQMIWGWNGFLLPTFVGGDPLVP
jgi:hypothetical protein